MNDGKRFENNFAESDTNEIFLRLYDPTGGYKGVANPCDFIGYFKPCQFMFELKATSGDRFAFSMLSETQYNGLMNKRKEGSITGALVKFLDHDLHYFFDIAIIDYIQIAKGKKSINIKDAEQYGTPFFGYKKRTNWEYKIEDLLNDLILKERL